MHRTPGQRRNNKQDEDEFVDIRGSIGETNYSNSNNNSILNNSLTPSENVSTRARTTATIPEKKESATFRLDKKVLVKLRREARRKEISINTLVSQVLKQHADWHFAAAQSGFISIRKALIERMLKEFDEEKIKQIATDVANDSSNKDLLFSIKNEYTIESALELIEIWLRVSGYAYQHNIASNNTNMHRFIIQHNMGRKWSLYLSELYRRLFEEFGVRDFSFDTTENMLVFTINI